MFNFWYHTRAIIFCVSLYLLIHSSVSEKFSLCFFLKKIIQFVLENENDVNSEFSNDVRMKMNDKWCRLNVEWRFWEFEMSNGRIFVGKRVIDIRHKRIQKKRCWHGKFKNAQILLIMHVTSLLDFVSSSQILYNYTQFTIPLTIFNDFLCRRQHLYLIDVDSLTHTHALFKRFNFFLFFSLCYCVNLIKFVLFDIFNVKGIKRDGNKKS